MNTSKFVIRWGEAAAVKPCVLADGGFSATTGADVPGETAFPLSVIFDDARAELRAQPPQVAEPLSDVMYAVWTGSLRVPVEVAQEREGVWFRSDLRCFLHKDEGARALLVADLAGHQIVREFPYGRKVGGEEFRQSVVHEAESLPVGGYAVSLLLVVERRGHESGADLRVDSLDVEINPNFRA
ncbi:MAG TPA: hypothetical protein VIP46_22805 [Pyrinomonadaceae bacterium]